MGAVGDQMQLAYLYVSRTYRGRGVGMRLFEAAASFAREAGAQALYVSATPTENTVDFYLNRGCVLAPEPDPALRPPSPTTSTSSICSDPPSLSALWSQLTAGAGARLPSGAIPAPSQPAVSAISSSGFAPR